MPTTPIESLSDTDLLRQFIDSRSPQAFTILVERYLPLIYSSALRQTRDPHLAEDVAQATLIVFSQRAAKIDPPILVGWLLKTTHFVARNALRQQFRRARYEKRAASMKSETQQPTESTDADGISKVIDPALAKLRDADRTAVVLRYFQNKSFADIATRMNTTEAAVQKRVSRAVQKLRQIVAAQGVTVSPAALPALLGSLKLHPVPPSLSLHAATAASTKSASTSLLAKGALKTMAAATKLKIGVATIVAILLVGASVPTVYYYAHQPAQSQQTQASAAPVASTVWLAKGTDLSKPLTGSLPPGVKANIIGIMRIDDGRWLSPTGGPATELPSDADSRLNDLNTSANDALLYSITRSLDLSIQTRLIGVNSRGSLGWANLFSPEYRINAFDPKNGGDSVQLAINVADGPWTDITVMPASSNSEVDGVSNGVAVKIFPVMPPEKGQQGLRVRCKLPDISNTSLRLIGIDANGKLVNSQGMFSNDQFTTFNFSETSAGYKEFHLQARPYNYHATFIPVPLPH